MVKLPDTIMRRLGFMLGDRKTCTLGDIKRSFYKSGYGVEKTAKWIELYFEIGVLQWITNDDGERSITCMWW
jgi:hypothetical protein